MMRVLGELTNWVKPSVILGLDCWERLQNPEPSIRHLAKQETPAGAKWFALATLAITGTAFYAASLHAVGLTLGWHAAGAMTWLLLSAGLPWLLLGTFLVSVMQMAWRTATHVCLVTMAVGEGVLIATGLGNLFLAFGGVIEGFNFFLLAGNIFMVILANAVMALAFTVLLRQWGVPQRQALWGWFIILNGSGLLLAWSFRWLIIGGVL